MIIIRYTEIGLKGKNRNVFEKRLQRNIKHCLKKNGIEFEKVLRKRGRIVIYTEKECPQLAKVFGISSFSHAKPYPLDMDTIKKEAAALYKGGTFVVRCKRSDKHLLPSPVMERDIGAYIYENCDGKVDLHNPEQTIYIEILGNHAYIFAEKIIGLSGLPVGTESHVVLLLQDEHSIEAGRRVLKRGCRVDVVKENGVDWSDLHQYEYGFTIKELDAVPEDTEAVVVSDTIENIKEYPYFVLRPMIG